jgi:hypothetical protein
VSWPLLQLGSATARIGTWRSLGGASKKLRWGNQPYHVGDKPDSRAVIVARPPLLTDSNEARRRLFHEILVTCPGDAPENMGPTPQDTLARSSFRDKPPQARFGRPEVEQALNTRRLARVDRRRSWLTRG